jgi:glyoxylase-like metal-dependent hydrolase (beta-lactamase superfamily II)
MMRVHDLDCCPMVLRLRDNPLAYLESQQMPTRCLLLELDDRLVLVDTGIGTAHVTRWRGQLPAGFVLFSRPTFDPESTAVAQIRALGHDPRDVTDIVFTHLDLDHAGGLGDFPHATAHVLGRELTVARSSKYVPGLQAGRYQRRLLRAHDRWRSYGTDGSEDWFGIPGAQRIEGLDAEVLLVPMDGHSKGHAGVAVKTDDEWLLHCGDVVTDVEQVTNEDHRLPFGLAAFEFGITVDRPGLHRSIEYLRTLHADGSCRIICAHDWAELPVDAHTHA